MCMCVFGHVLTAWCCQDAKGIQKGLFSWVVTDVPSCCKKQIITNARFCCCSLRSGLHLEAAASNIFSLQEYNMWEVGGSGGKDSGRGLFSFFLAGFPYRNCLSTGIMDYSRQTSLPAIAYLGQLV